MTPETPSPLMLTCLRIAQRTGALHAVGGGYWVSSACPEDKKADLLAGRNRDNWPDFVGTRTIYACEERGWLKRSHALAAHRVPRYLTEAGRGVLEREARVQP